MKRALLIASLTLISGCFLPSFEKVEATGGNGGNGGAAPVCETITFSETTDGETSTSDANDFFNALRVIELGEVELPERPGFDLDGVCTCCLDCEQAPTCNPPLGAQGDECDSVEGTANQGRDNNLAKFLARPESTPLGISSTALRAAMAGGTWTLLLRVSDWNGLPNDGKVTLSVYTTPGSLTAPTWNGSDVFQVRSDSVTVGSMDIEQPLISNSDAYVADGVLVAVFGVQNPLVLHLDNAFSIELSYAILQAEIREEDNGHMLNDGVIGGIWDVRAAFEALAGARLGDQPRMCTDYPTYEEVKQGLCIVRDSLDEPEPITCGGISFGMSFTGGRIAAPTLVEDFVDNSAACPAETDPTNDLCE